MSTEKQANRTPQNGDSQLESGFRFINSLVMGTKVNHVNSLVDLHALIDLLISKGLISSREFNQRRELIGETLSNEFAQDPLKVELDPTPDKYQLETCEVDCEQRYPICKARCCKLRVALSTQDLDEGIARWDYGSPYNLATDEEGFCTHFDKKTLQCSIYDHRPAVCRTYHCASDDRIWKDYKAGILADEQ